ncbi:DUF5615 family PIN-like protein [Larkinella terrae]|uniref:DUF5615 domain-containing protein n=1 Tax=Larkinella terrae TaxID=2025311 RepID=A0A7K0EVU2_9BACT|nr:DUF5615 family PIN-like protein [Larkinella terrae]MRS65889.1 hypothetical protein [Larkinella terrae]
MHIADFKLLADENISQLLIDFLSRNKCDIISVRDIGFVSKPDTAILDWAYHNQRVVLTLDSDFGGLIFAANAPYWGIIYLRPGHLLSGEHLLTLEKMILLETDFEPPFILVGERKDKTVRFRFKH